MISEQTKQKFALIVKNMTPEQRAQLQSHLEGLSEEQKWEMVQRIVDAYDKKMNSAPVKEAQTHEEPEEEPEDEPEHPQVKRKLKKSVRNTLIGGIAGILLIACGLIIYFNKDSIPGSAQEEIVITDPVVTETTVAETIETTPSPTPTVTPTPAPTQVPLASDHPDLSTLTIVIDPGHQQTTDSTEELYASWLSSTKPRCTSGTSGIVTGIPEYELTLNYSLIIADYLEQCGANVILTRDTDDVNISNQERAQIAVDAQADLFLRIHADAAGDSAASGVRVYIPDSGDFTDTSSSYAQELAELVAEAEGFEVNDVRSTSLYTGLNYANSVRSFQISLGFLSNSDDEAVLTSEDNPAAVAEAISLFCAEFVL